MKISLGLLFIAITASASSPARAERWVVKNPRVSLGAFTALRSIDLGASSYAVVEAPAFVTLAEMATYGEAAFTDATIGVPKDTDDSSDDGLVPVGGSDAKIAWHVQSLQYAKLPAKYYGQGVTVAVVDSGVDYKHEALQGHIWTNPKEIPDNGIDDDGNGYIDDVHGWDFELNKNDPQDAAGHGTHCAGIIAAMPNPENQAQGLALGARVMAVRVIGDKSHGFLSDAVAGIKYAVNNGAKVLSNSWRIYRSWNDYDPTDENIEMLKQAIVYASEHGAVFVAAAGNESVNMDTDFDRDPIFPGGYTGLNNFIVVAASDQTGDPAYFTNYGASRVTVAAPGVAIISTTPNDQWGAKSGTSMATPLVAAAVARGLSAGYPAAEIADRLMRSSAAGGNWDSKVRSKGVISLLPYLTP